MKRQHALTAAAFGFAIVLAACTGGGAGTPAPSPSPRPTEPPASTQPAPTQPAPIVGSPEEAAARVIASDSRFAGIARKNADLIGQGSWWEASVTSSGYRVHVQIGWGDCPAGCIDRHDWIFDVAADGTITLVEETGDPLPGTTS